MNLGNVLSTRALPVVAVLALIFFHAGTAAAQPGPDPLTGNSPDRPPASAQLAFVREGQIFLVNADGTGLVQLTNSPDSLVNVDPTWSPDGQRLAFSRNSGEPYAEIYMMNADGTNVLQLTSGGFNVEPAWGPDGNTIVYSSHLAGSMGLRTLAADGSEPGKLLLNYPGWEGQPAWSPDGRRITFTTDAYQAYDYHYDLGIMAADGSGDYALIKGPFFSVDGLTYFFQSAWSPDGQSIAVIVCPYAWDNCYPESSIAIVNPDGPPDGSEYIEIAQAGGYASPTWSPDGQWIAFGSTACRSCPSSIRFASADGSVEGLLVNDGHSPAWRPDPDTLNGPDEPDGPVKDPDEPKEPPPPKLPRCGSKCDTKAKLTRTDNSDQY